MLMLLQTLMNFILLWKTKGDVQQNVTGPQQGHIRIIRALHVTNDALYKKQTQKYIDSQFRHE